MADPTGRSFLSYRRSRSDEARLLIEAQHDRGIPTWQDIDNLGLEPFGEGIRKQLADQQTANAILWLTRDVKDSSVINKLEAPMILERAAADDTFFVVPVAADEMSVDEASQVLDQRFSIQNVNRWNMLQVDGNPIEYADAAKVADRILRQRLALTHRTLPPDAPIGLKIFTGLDASVEPGTAIVLDWSHRFMGRMAKPGVWEEYLLPSLKAVVGAIRTQAKGRSVEASGLLSIPASVALGCAFLQPLNLPIRWKQTHPQLPEQFWSISEPRVELGFEKRFEDSDFSAEDLAVLVSVTNDVTTDFAASKLHLPKFRAIVRVSKSSALRHDISVPGMATDVAYLVSESIRESLTKYRGIKQIHLFLAVPVGLGMMIGQLLNTFGLVQTYEHVRDDAACPYHKSVLLKTTW